MKKLVQLSVTDFKLIFRDPSLRVFLAMPLLVFGIVLFVMPVLLLRFEGAEVALPIVFMGSVMQTSTMFGFIYAMVLINEKDIHVAKVYGILPVSKTVFISFRMLIPWLLSTVFTFLLLLTQPFYSFNVFSMILLSVLCGLLAPLLTIGITILSKNKMEGMTWFKLVNLLTSLPLAAFFIEKYDSYFGVIPTHWIFQTLHKMIRGESYFMSITIGFGFFSVLLIFIIKRFTRVHFQ